MNKIPDEIKISVLERGLLSLVFTIIVILSRAINPVIFQKILESAQATIKELVNSRSINNIPLEVPVFAFWFIMGILFYFFFFSLTYIYREIENYLILRLTYVIPGKCDLKKCKKVFPLKRFLIHFAVIDLYVSFIMVITFFLIPFGNNIAEIFASFFFRVNFNSNLYYIFLATIIFVYWFIIFSLISKVFNLLRRINKEEDFIEEHRLDNID